MCMQHCCLCGSPSDHQCPCIVTSCCVVYLPAVFIKLLYIYIYSYCIGVLNRNTSNVHQLSTLDSSWFTSDSNCIFYLLQLYEWAASCSICVSPAASLGQALPLCHPCCCRYVMKGVFFRIFAVKGSGPVKNRTVSCCVLSATAPHIGLLSLPLLILTFVVD